MSSRVERSTLQIAPELVDFVEKEALPGTGVAADAFWTGLSDLIHDLGPRNRELLAIRDEMQTKMPAGTRMAEDRRVFHWSGENSERARIKAGLDLLERFLENEERCIPYHVIGHSHGGSVIWHALRMAELKNHRLPLSPTVSRKATSKAPMSRPSPKPPEWSMSCVPTSPLRACSRNWRN